MLIYLASLELASKVNKISDYHESIADENICTQDDMTGDTKLSKRADSEFKIFTFRLKFTLSRLMSRIIGIKKCVIEPICL